MMKPLWNLIAVIVLVALVLGACSDSTDSKVNLQAVEKGETPLAEETVSEDVKYLFSEDSPRLPAIAGLNGRILFVFRDDLYLGQFDGNTVHRLDTAIDEMNIYLSPKRDLAVYVVEMEAGVQLKVVELDTLETASIYKTSGQLHTFEWSPDGNWISFIETQPMAAGLESRQQSQKRDEPGLSTPQLPKLIISNPQEKRYVSGIAAFATAWLVDNTLLVAALAYGADGREALLRVNPQTEEISEINYQGPVQEIAGGLGNLASRPSIRSALEAHGLILAPPGDSKYYGLTAINSDGTAFVTLVDAGPASTRATCKNLSLTRQSLVNASLPDVIYQGVGQSVHSLKWLQDGSILFVLLPCEAGASLLLLTPEGKTKTIADRAIPNQGYTFAILDDKRVMWIGIDQEATSCLVSLTDLQEDQTSQLFSTACDQGIELSALYWIPN